jgi:outer membrane protein OmpA-like peptidoglycan-associated protein
MKKITLMLVAMFGMAMAASAQYTGNKFFDNWSIGLEGGTSTNLCDWDTPNGGVVGINLTKGITPVLSLEFQLQAGISDNENWNWSFLYQKGVSSNVINNATFMGNTKINLMNWFCGYKGEPRLFEIQARGGFGFARYFMHDNGAESGAAKSAAMNRCVFKFGLDFDWNLGKDKAWTISLRPAVILKTSRDNDPLFDTFQEKVYNDATRTLTRVQCDNDPNERSFLHNGVAQITAGVTYHFKTSNGTRHFAEVKPEEVTKIVEKIVEKPVEKIVEKIVEKPVANTKGMIDGGGITIEFAQNKANLSNTAKAKLNAIEKGTVVALDGYASPEGAKSYNQKLSQRRCDAVKAYLEDRGVKVADVTAHGAASAESQRVVYITIK